MDINARPNRRLRCAIYTRKSSEEGLDMEFNSLDAQREACEAYIASQRSEGWVATRERYDDGGFSGGTLERPGLKQLLADIDDGLIDVVVVYKIDRLSRSLMDFSKLVEIFDRNGVTFVSVTQSFNTTTSMGRLTLNILLSFAQFEREVIRQAFDQPESAGETWRRVADQLRARWPKLTDLMDESEHDVLAYMAFPRQHRTKLHSTNPIERLNKEVKRRADVVGIFPNEASITRLIGAVLFEQNDEWQTASRYMMVEAFAEIDAEETDPILSLSTQAA